MNLSYHFCKCNQIEIRKSCDITRAILLNFLYLFILAFDYSALHYADNANQIIDGISCEHSNEYEEMHKSCISIEKQINNVKELADFPSTYIPYHANKIIEELKEVLDQKNQTFQLLRQERQTCITIFITNELKTNEEFYRMVWYLNFILFFIATFWILLPDGDDYEEDEILHPAIMLSLLLFLVSLLYKIISMFTSIDISEFLKSENIEKYLLNF